MKSNTIAVIGGTGKSGRFLVQKLIKEGYPVKLLLRNPDFFTLGHPLIETIQGDARDFNSINRLVKGCRAVISTLGQPKGERSIFSDAAHNIIGAMNLNQVKRYITTTGLSVNTPFDVKSERVSMATDWMYQNYTETTQDKQKEYELLSESNLEWTLVRLPLIRLTEQHFKTETNLEDCKGEGIGAADLAEFLVSQIEEKDFIKQSPFLYNL